MNRTRTSKNAKRLLVWLLLLTMVFGLLPMAAFADEDSYKFERLLTLLRTAEDKQLLSMIGEIDLSDGTAITFTYLDRFTVKMPWDADIAYKLGNVRTVVEQLEANQTGTINLMNDGRADFIPE